MRAIRVASLALIGTAALALGAPAAVAADDDGNSATSFGFTATPATVAPGGTVTLNATECEAPTVTASSGVFETVTLNEGQSATTKIAADAKPDAKYDVTFDCKGEKGTAPLTITSGSGSRTDTGTVADVGTGTEAGTDAGAGTETGADAGTEMNTDSDADTGTETGATRVPSWAPAAARQVPGRKRAPTPVPSWAAAETQVPGWPSPTEVTTRRSPNAATTRPSLTEVPGWRSPTEVSKAAPAAASPI